MNRGTIAVTGGSGKAGRALVGDLVDHGYEVRNVDVAPPIGESPAPFLKTDLTDLGQTFEALHGTDAVVHLAAIPGPGITTPEVTFRVNMASTFNVFTAASSLGLERIVWASSETTLGLPFERHPPRYVPVDEEHPLVRGDGTPLQRLRFSNVMEPHDYARFAEWHRRPR